MKRGKRADREHDWNEAALVRFAALWADHAITAAAIGEMLGISKSAVCGKARRMGLPERPSWGGWRMRWAKAELPPKPPKVPRVARPKVTLAPAAPAPEPAPAAPPPPPSRDDALSARPDDALSARPDDALSARRDDALSARRPKAPPARERCWYLSGTTKPYLRCRSPAVRGSYCAEHAAICFLPNTRIAHAADR